MRMKALSVIIPIGPGDKSWWSLLQDLESLSPDDEIIFVSCEENLEIQPHQSQLEVKSPSKIINLIQKKYHFKCQLNWYTTERGRAKQMNFGAAKAKNSLLWFLHCDSRLKKGSIEALKNKLENSTNSLFYFDLIFNQNDISLIMINTIGAWIRSHFLKLPFGDQGLAMSKSLFSKLGGYSENLKYGEDHILIWKAHQLGIPIKSMGLPIFTSPRKYQLNGWTQTTLLHLFFTYKQATPELIKFLFIRRKSSR